MEVWDAYRKDGTKAGFDLYRDDPIPDGFFHVVSEVLVRHVDGTFLVVQRAWNKNGNPGLFEAGAGGSVLKGETPYQGALRELREETGINANDLIFVFAQSDLMHTIYYGFLCITDCPKDSIVLQEGETISYRWLNKTEFLNFIKGKDFLAGQRERWLPFIERILSFEMQPE